eukprot:tig00020556_g11023.t1
MATDQPRPRDDENNSRRDTRKVLKDKTKFAPLMELMYAAFEGDLDNVKTVIESGVIDINLGDYDHRTALHVAASEGELEIVRYLISKGADFNAKDRWLNTPLQDAIRHQHDQVVDLLASHGAKADQEDLALALCNAASRGAMGEVTRLVKAGADVNRGDYDHRTPLHLAASEGKQDVCQYLLDLGADFHALDRWRNTPLQDALRHNKDNVAKLLTNKGAQVSDRDFSVDSAFTWEIDFSEVTLVDKIGSGAFAEVWKGLWRGNKVAIKKLKAQDVSPQSVMEFRREVAMLSKIRHPNIVLFMAACTKPPNLAICCEFLGGGSIYDELHGKGGPRKIEYPVLLEYGVDVAIGMNHLHKSHFIHRDLKSANLVRDDRGTIKIVDFGLSRIEDEYGNMTGETGSYRWAAPEVLRNERYSEKVDIYSYAIVIWEMLTGEVPYSDLSPIQAAVAVAEKNVRPEIPKGTPAGLAQLISEMWDPVPANRPPFEEIVARLRHLREEYEEKMRSGKSWFARKLEQLRGDDKEKENGRSSKTGRARTPFFDD